MFPLQTLKLSLNKNGLKFRVTLYKSLIVTINIKKRDFIYICRYNQLSQTPAHGYLNIIFAFRLFDVACYFQKIISETNISTKLVRQFLSLAIIIVQTLSLYTQQYRVVDIYPNICTSYLTNSVKMRISFRSRSIVQR